MIYLTLSLSLALGLTFRHFCSSPAVKILGNYYAFLIILLFCGFVTFTPDWDGYVYSMEAGNGRDFLFTHFADYFNKNNLDYSSLHLLYIFIYTWLCVFFVKKISSRNDPIIVIAYISVIYLFYTTQIRYFLAYFLACWAYYLLLVCKRRYSSLLVFSFAVLSHYGILGFLPVLFLITSYKNNIKKFSLLITIIGGLFFLIAVNPILFSLINEDFYLNTYFESEDGRSSFLGSLFVFWPYILSSLLLYLVVRSIKKENKSSNDLHSIKFDFCWKISVGTMLYIPTAFIFQIVGYRFIVPSLIFHILAWSYLIRDRKIPINNSPLRIKLYKVWLFFFGAAYLLPYLFGYDYDVSTVKLVFESNLFFK